MLRISQPHIECLQPDVNTGRAVIVYPTTPYFCQLLETFLITVRFGLPGDGHEFTFERFPNTFFSTTSRYWLFPHICKLEQMNAPIKKSAHNKK